MPRRALLVPAALFCVLIAAIVIGACSKGGGGYGTTYPAPGGGGTTSFNLAFPATGASQSYTFTTAGSFLYHCVPHGTGSGTMKGTVVVSAGATADSDTVAVGIDASNAPALAFKPSSVTIKPGGHVRWINRSSMVNHTMTYP